jgi:hypothetical protein
MPYTLDEFCKDCHQALAADKGPGGREAVRQNLERLLAEEAFLDKHVLSMPAGRRTSTPRRRSRRRTTTARPGRSTVRHCTTPT